MLTLRPSTIPLYLRSSQLYRSYNYDDNEFEVPINKFKVDLSLKSFHDLLLLLDTLDHWGSDECFLELIDYIYNTLSKANLKTVCNKYGEIWNLRYIKLLHSIREKEGHPINLPLLKGYAPIAVYMRSIGFELNEDSLTSVPFRIECVRFVLQEIQIVHFKLPVEKGPPTTVLVKRCVRIRPSQVPSFLHSSELYKSLDFEHDDEFEVPVLHFKLDLTLNSVVDLVLLLDTLDYWGSDEIFTEVLFYMYHTCKLLRPLEAEPHFIHQNYAHRWKYVELLLKVVGRKQPDAQMSTALQFGNVRLVSFLREQGLPLDDMSIQYAIRSQNPDCIRYVLENKDFILPAPTESSLYFPRRLNFNPAQAADLNMIKYCIAERLMEVMNEQYCMIAAKAGDLEVLQQLHELRCPWDVTCCTEAAAHGHLHCLTYAHDQGAPWDASTCAAAAKNKHMECLTYLIENSCTADGAVCRAAVANGDLEMLIFAHENLLPWEDDMCMLAALAGSLPCLKYLHEAGCELTSETCAAAATRHDCECLKYAHENGAPWTVSTTIAAAKSHNLTGLEYAHQNGCPVDQRVCMAAIKVNCAVPMLWYMGTNKFPFDANLCRQAAKQGSENLLRFLYLHACPWTVATTRDAAAGGHIEILKFAAEEGCPVTPVTCSFGQYCGDESSHFECMKYVFDNHDSSFDSISAITREHFACFCYAHNNGTPWSEEIVVTAARLGKLDYLTYAFEEGGCPFYPYYQRVYDAVVENAHEECISYLDELYEEKTQEIGRILRDRRRQQRVNGWMLIRKVMRSNWFTSHKPTYNCRLPANRFWTAP